MKPTLLSVKEVAQEMGVSTQSIRRAYWRGEIPAYRSAKCCASIWNGSSESFWRKGCQGSYDHAERDRRRQPATRSAETPPFGKTGACIAEEQWDRSWIRTSLQHPRLARLHRPSGDGGRNRSCRWRGLVRDDDGLSWLSHLLADQPRPSRGRQTGDGCPSQCQRSPHGSLRGDRLHLGRIENPDASWPGSLPVGGT